jgi:Family of unknown function (DUF5681)
MTKSESTGRKQDTRFKPGQSGNPAGKPKGTRNKVTRAIEALLDGEGEALTRKAVELAKEGDIAALRLCIDRLVPPRRDRPVSFDLPNIDSARDAASAISAMIRAVSVGDLTPVEASDVARLLDAYVKAFEAAELAERVVRLEKMVER